jgi:hypothetical protein
VKVAKEGGTSRLAKVLGHAYRLEGNSPRVNVATEIGWRSGDFAGDGREAARNDGTGRAPSVRDRPF